MRGASSNISCEKAVQIEKRRDDLGSERKSKLPFIGALFGALPERPSERGPDLDEM
jgi:hypothetical protein